MPVIVLTDNTTPVNAAYDSIVTGKINAQRIISGGANQDSQNLWQLEITDTDKTRTSVSRFELDDIPAGATINSATAYALCFTGNWASNGIDFYRLLVAYVNSEVTGDIRSTGNNWGTVLARGDGTDRFATHVSRTTVADASAAWRSWDFTTWAQGVVDGSYSNFGMMMEAQNVGLLDRSIAFRGPLGGTDGERMELYIDYTAASSASKRNLAGFGGLAGPNGGLVHG